MTESVPDHVKQQMVANAMWHRRWLVVSGSVVAAQLDNGDVYTLATFRSEFLAERVKAVHNDVLGEAYENAADLLRHAAKDRRYFPEALAGDVERLADELLRMKERDA